MGHVARIYIYFGVSSLRGKGEVLGLDKKFVVSLPAAEAKFILGALFGTAKAVPLPGKVKINVKSVGQECPTHMGNFKIKGGDMELRGSHLSQTNAKDGAPSLVEL